MRAKECVLLLVGWMALAAVAGYVAGVWHKSYMQARMEMVK
jgi:hypothetical protein